MPNIITHSIFAEDFIEEYPLEFLKERKHLVQVGSNGPDILFFHNVNPARLLKMTPLHHIGNELHHENINRFYNEAYKAIQKEEDEEIRQDMKAYTVGHLLHWSLDSAAHPYVFYRTGDCHGRSSWNHHRLESLIDSAMLKIKRDETILDHPISKEVSALSPEEKRAITRIYYPVVEDIYPGQIEPHHIAESLDDWHFVQSFLYDPNGIKYKMLTSLEKPLQLQRLLSGLIVPVQAEDNHDILNLMHSVWKHPATEEIHQESFLDLYDLGQARAREVVTLFLNALDNPERLENFLGYLNNRSYNMGANPALEPHLFDPIVFEK